MSSHFIFILVSIWTGRLEQTYDPINANHFNQNVHSFSSQRQDGKLQDVEQKLKFQIGTLNPL